MSTRLLKLLTVIFPLVFMIAVIIFRVRFFPANRALEGNIYSILVVAVGATLFSLFIFNIIEHREEEIRRGSRQLEALHEAALALTNELDLQIVLQKVVDLSRELLHAKYGALAVLDLEGKRIEQFFNSGGNASDLESMMGPPKGLGLLNAKGPSSQPLLVDDISQDHRAAGFPQNHPVMRSLLGVPIKSKGEIFGNLYLTDKIHESGKSENSKMSFNDNDRQLLEKFATQAAIAIENAQLYRKTQELAVLQERERFSMDLHDGIMQSVYATGLSLQEAQHELNNEQPEIHKRMEQAIQDLSQVLRDIRNYILGLRPGRFQGQNIVKGIAEIAQELRANTLLNVKFEALKKEEFDAWEGEPTMELLFITQEALTNIRKHSHARNVEISLGKDGDSMQLNIDDDGIGFDLKSMSEIEGNGLRNMQERARTIGAKISFKPKEGKGTQIRVLTPLPENQTA